MGLIMGGLTLRDDLNLCIGKVSAALRGKEFSDGGRQKGEWYKDFNLAEVRFVSLSLSLCICVFESVKSINFSYFYLLENSATSKRWGTTI